MAAEPCPECGEPLGTEAADCPHCGVELANPDGGGMTDDASMDPRSFDPDFGLYLDTTDDDGGSDSDTTDSPSLLDPASWLDSSLTVGTGFGLSIVAGQFALAIGWALPDARWGLFLWAPVMVGLIFVLATRHSVYETIRLGCYANAVLIFCLPLITFSNRVSAGATFVERLVDFAVAGISLGLVGIVLAGLGYWAGKRVPAKDEAA